MKKKCYMVSFFAKYTGKNETKNGLGFAFIYSNETLFQIIENIKSNLPTECEYKKTFCIKECNNLKDKINKTKIDYRFSEFKNLKYFNKK